MQVAVTAGLNVSLIPHSHLKGADALDINIKSVEIIPENKNHTKEQ